jgi:predicted lysophospholipase L1 biosynthesis ABC-type transport system permease subunit
VNWLHKIQLRIRALFQQHKLDADMNEEMRSHVELRTDANVEAGMNAEEARLAAVREFGWTESIKEECRDQRGVRLFENISRDMQHAFRQLRKSPALALIIAAVGIFGVISCQVAQRTNEFGVRLALGCSPQVLLRLVLSKSGKLALLGIAIGLAFSFATNRLLASQVFGLSPHDPFILGTVSALLLLVSLAASFFPARRAGKVGSNGGVAL